MSNFWGAVHFDGFCLSTQMKCRFLPRRYFVRGFEYCMQVATQRLGLVLLRRVEKCGKNLYLVSRRNIFLLFCCLAAGKTHKHW